MSEAEVASAKGAVIMGYRPMTIAGLAAHLSREIDEKIRWKYVWEFLEEYRWEPVERRVPQARRLSFRPRS